MSDHINHNPQYSYTKGTRLKLTHLHGMLPKPEDGNGDLNALLTEGKKLSECLETFIYYKREDDKWAKNKQGQRLLTKLVNVNKKWLKDYFQQDFYAGKKKPAHTLDQMPYLNPAFARWFKTWEARLKELREYIDAPEHRQSRRADIGFTLQALDKKEIFPFVCDFAKNANHKDEDNPLPKIAEAFEEKLAAALQEYLPAQSAGIIIARASLNYYTVNKKPKEYYEDELKKAREQFIKKNEQYLGSKTYKADQKSRLYEAINQGKVRKIEDIDKTDLDLFKGNPECLKEVIRLTKAIAEKAKVQNRAKQKGQKSSDKNNLTKLSQERGFYFIKKTRGKQHENYFHKWWEFCEDYKKLAQEMGKLKAQIKGLEKEQSESQQLRYWALIAEPLDKRRPMAKELWLIPKKERQAARKFLNGFGKAAGEITVTQFFSLTKRALHKLCFAEESSFVEGMPDELRRLQMDVKKATNDPKELERQRRNNPSQKSKAKLELEFFKKLIKSKYGIATLDLTHFDLSGVDAAKDGDEFEIALEKACYTMQQSVMSKAERDKFLKKYDVLCFDLTSYDIEEHNNNTHQTPESDYKRHTRELWQKFWQEKEPDIRLNPEITLRYRKKNEELEDYLKKRDFDMARTKHRMLQDQYMAHLSFEINAGKKYPQLAFTKPEEIKKKIDEFNQDFNNRNWENMWRYGIDRGNIELATLCLAKFNPKDYYEYNGKPFLNPRFPSGEQDIKVYALKPKWYDQKAVSELETKPREDRKEKRIIANLSYFIDKVDDPEWFESKSCSCIDLTTAKVIRGHIIENGDVLTFLKLKKESAKRILFELVASQAITKENAELEWGSEDPSDPQSVELRYKPLNEDGEEGEDQTAKAEDCTIYFFENNRNRGFDGLLIRDDMTYSKESLRKNLQNYLDQLLKEKNKPSADTGKHVPPINKINQLRDALVSNMIGVIFHLQKEYPGIVVLEDLDMDLIAKHFQDLNINISRRLEWALYRKFQGMGAVPPHIKGVTTLREKARNKGEEQAKKKAEEEYQAWLEKNPRKSDENKEKKRKEFENNHLGRFRQKYTQQIGAIVYVNKSNTSKACPYCSNRMAWYKKQDGKEKDIAEQIKFEQRRFVCGEKKPCGFDTDHFHNKKHSEPPLSESDRDFSAFRELDDPDKVAAYNVAKKAIKRENMKKFAQEEHDEKSAKP